MGADLDFSGGQIFWQVGIQAYTKFALDEDIPKYADDFTVKSFL